jgi:hypothetical protein
VGQLARTDGLSMAAAAEAYARGGSAVTDAFIQCWDTKYLSNLQRPVTYIQDCSDGTRLPYNVRPSFPTSTSGHSTLSGAAIAVLTAMVGVQAFTDTTHTDHGLRPHTFNSIDEAAEEATVSRLYKYFRSRPPCVSLGGSVASGQLSHPAHMCGMAAALQGAEELLISRHQLAADE